MSDRKIYHDSKGREVTEFALNTALYRRWAFGHYSQICGGRALCSDGKVRALYGVREPDTWFSVPCHVVVNRKGKRYTVVGFIVTESVAGYDTATDDDPAVVRFIANTYNMRGQIPPDKRILPEWPMSGERGQCLGQ